MNRMMLIPHFGLVAIIMAASACMIVQTVCITRGFRRLERRGEAMLENLMEITVLLQLLTMTLMLAETLYHQTTSFAYPTGHEGLRRAVFLTVTVMSVIVSWKRRLFWPLSGIVLGALILPLTEEISGSAYPVLFLGTLAAWLVRGIHLLVQRQQEEQRQLSAISIKEAVDNLDFGILFCQHDGQILLQNSRMQELMRTMTGRFQVSGKAFYEALQAGRTLPGCRREELGDQLTYWLPDGSVWVFDRHIIRNKNQRYILLSAGDRTDQWRSTHQLWLQNQELERRNRELQDLLDNLDTICKTEETIHAKSRVHDVLGQRISLLLRAMREHREPDEVLLSSFAEGLPRDLTNASADGACSLDTLVQVFRGLGVTIRVQGCLPKEETTAKTLFEIAAEAVTNAVRHGYASEVWITIVRRNGCWQMGITDSGIPADGPITEGGGLQGMRRKAETLGGSFRYCQTPQFQIHVEIPEGGEA